MIAVLASLDYALPNMHMSVSRGGKPYFGTVGGCPVIYASDWSGPS